MGVRFDEYLLMRHTYTRMVRVELTREAQANFDSLPVTIRIRVDAILHRLTQWPEVSGAKPMRGALKGHYRIRTGDWRVLFTVSLNVIVVRIEHRSTIYED
jgi:mRNA-degrading endonuclease RelE of RelBE toxin-antitoxin system